MSERGWLHAASLRAGVDVILPELQRIRRRERLPRVSWRKRRLFACAAVRRAWPLLADERGRRAVEVAERYADGQADSLEMQAAHAAALDAGGHQPLGGWGPDTDDPIEALGKSAAHFAAMSAACAAAAHLDVAAARWSLHAVVRAVGEAHPDPPLPEPLIGRVLEMLRRTWAADPEVVVAARVAEQAAQVDLLTCVYGNPFRPWRLVPSWLTWDGGTVVRLAQAAEDDRVLPAGTLDAAHLSILADALEDAGCTDADILSHLRGPGPHARGCWALDLVLQRADCRE